MTLVVGQTAGGAHRRVAARGLGGHGLGAPSSSGRRGLGGDTTSGGAPFPGQRGAPGDASERGAIPLRELVGHPLPGGGELGGLPGHVQGGRAHRRVAVPGQHRPEQSDRGVRSFGQPPVNPGPVPDRGVDVT